MPSAQDGKKLEEGLCLALIEVVHAVQQLIPSGLALQGQAVGVAQEFIRRGPQDSTEPMQGGDAGLHVPALHPVVHRDRDGCAVGDLCLSEARAEARGAGGCANDEGKRGAKGGRAKGWR